MVRYNKDDPWCAKQAPDLCSEAKVELAFDLCSRTFAERIAENQRKEAMAAEELSRRNDLRADLLAQEAVLQERRKVINNRKAELQRKEQALRERERALSERKAELR
jgi:hypothetical protein